MTNFRLFLLVFCVMLLLSACGQRGPLYLPDASAPVVVPAPTGQLPGVPPAATPAVPPALPPNPRNTGFEDENRLDADDPEDEQADGL